MISKKRHVTVQYNEKVTCLKNTPGLSVFKFECKEYRLVSLITDLSEITTCLAYSEMLYKKPAKNLVASYRTK